MSEEKDPVEPVVEPIEKTYFNEDGEEVKFPGTPESIKKLLDESNTEILAKEKELKGLRDKDFNFKRVKNMSVEEKAKFDEKELVLKQQIEDLQDGQDKTKNQLVENWKDKAIRSMVGSDEELKKKIIESYETLNIEANTEFEIGDKVVKAFLSTGLAPVGVSNPLTTASHGVSASPDTEKGIESKASKEFGNKFGLTADDKKKYKKGVKII